MTSTWMSSGRPVIPSAARGDTFRCADGTDLTSHLADTLRQLSDEGICTERHFEIRGPSGGA